MNLDLEEMRNHLRLVQETENIGLRGLQELTGVSFSTLSRFLKGTEPTFRVLQQLEAFCSGEPPHKADPVAIRRFKVSGKTFILEIREIL